MLRVDEERRRVKTWRKRENSGRERERAEEEKSTFRALRASWAASEKGRDVVSMLRHCYRCTLHYMESNCLCMRLELN